MPDLLQEWFRVWEDRPGIWVIEEPLHDEEVKSYLVLGAERAVLVDTGMGVGDIAGVVRGITPLPVSVVQSHAHLDHVGGAWQFNDVGIHESEADDLAAGVSSEQLDGWFTPARLNGPLPESFDPGAFSIRSKSPTRLYRDGDLIDLGDRVVEVIHAPGHSRGGLVLLDREDRSLYSTDVVYLRSLYLLNPDSSVSDYVRSLERLAELAPSVERLYPSHGPTPISPDLILPMLEGMRAVSVGRTPDGVEAGARIIEVHDFGEFRILRAQHEKTGQA